MKSERHNTHILSNSSTDEQNNIDKTNSELKSSKLKVSERNITHPMNKIDLKDLFKNINEREKNKIIYLEGNEEENEEIFEKQNEEVINYWKNMNTIKDKRKNITQNLKDWINKTKQYQEMKTQNLEIIEKKTYNKNNENDFNKNEENKSDNKSKNNNERENGAKKENVDEENINKSKISNTDSVKSGNTSNRINTNNNKNILNTNKENKLEEEIKTDKKLNIEASEENEGNKESIINENNENSFIDDFNINNEKELYSNINDTNFNDSEILDNKKQNTNYKKSNFNFYVIQQEIKKEENKDNKNNYDKRKKKDGKKMKKKERELKKEKEKREKKEEREEIGIIEEKQDEKQESSEETKELKKLIEERMDSENNNNFNSSEENNDFVEEYTNNIKEKKLQNKNNHLQNNNNINKINKIKKKKAKKSPENNKNSKVIKNKYIRKVKSKSNSINKYKENKTSNYNDNKKIIKKKKYKKNSQNKKLKNQKEDENNIKNINNNKTYKEKNSNKKEILKNINSHNNKNKIKTTGDVSNKDNKDNMLFVFASAKNIINNNEIIKREIIIPIPRKCHFLKTTIQMDSEQFNLLNKKIQLIKEKNKIFRHKRNEYTPIYRKNNEIDKFNFYDEINNGRKFIDLEYESNNTQNYLNNKELAKSNNNQRTFINNRDFNNYMNSRLISPNILINRHINKNLENKKKYQEKLTDIPFSPYILNKYNFVEKRINKSNSALNLFNNHNKKSNKKLFPNISNNHNSLKPGNSIIDISNIPSDINLNFCKSNTIFNFNPKNKIFIPTIQKRYLESGKSANIHKFDNNNFKSFEMLTPISNATNKINLDMKNFHNAKKFVVKEKGFGKHFGNEKDCPICQSVSMKSNYIMKNMNHYHEFIKPKDQNKIKLNKEQFLQELKKPNTKSQKMLADIMKEIKQFIYYSKHPVNMNNCQNDTSIINAYFGL